MKQADSPQVYIPPPLIYAGFFFISILLQKWLPIKHPPASYPHHTGLGYFLLGTGLISLIPALLTFLKTKNTLVTIKPANSLQTSGIYSITRNPMYLGLVLIYISLAVFKGNWWTLILLPILIWTIQQTVIRREENYLHRRFPGEYPAYKERVRRWI